MELPSITVSQLNTYVKKLFDDDVFFASVIVCGEISNLSPHYKTGHIYFSLKDEHAAVKAVMFAGQARRLRFRPENGMKVFAVGRVGVFERDGVYQIYVNDMTPDGEGALAAAFRQRKERLAAQGLFDEAHKKPLPRFPRRIGVITSPGGAALQDMLNILGRRWPCAEIVLAGVTVQGQRAPQEMIDALQAFHEGERPDVIILGRGGGSAEDLWCFNDERLARAIYASEIPVISAVGHETDFSISDFVADRRAPTPSAAAELAAPDLSQQLRQVAALRAALFSAYAQKLTGLREKLTLLQAQRDFTQPGVFFAADRERLNALDSALSAAAVRRLGAARAAYEGLDRRLTLCVQRSVNEKKLRYTRAYTALDKLNPLSVLLRGFAMVTLDDRAVDTAAALSPGDEIGLRLHDGRARAKILEVSGEGLEHGEANV